MSEIILKNGTIVDVEKESCFQADVKICDGRIIGIGSFSGENEADCTGKYLCPGFIDAHVHIESSMVTPNAFAGAVLPHGTTTVIADPHEMVNVKGNAAMKYLLDSTRDIGLDVFVMLPSSIPSSPFETNGADFTAEDMKQWIDHERVLGLGEVMCYPAVLAGDPAIMDKIALCRGKVIDGHAPGLSGKDLAAYVAAGVMTDHECTTYEEAAEKHRAGMKILIREGSAARNLDEIVNGLLSHGDDVDDYMFCTDDKHLDTIEKEGHISYNVKRAVQLGMKAETAIAMASFHSARTYGIDKKGVIKEGYDADIVVLDSLDDISIHSVYKKGIPVTEDLLTHKETSVPKEMLHTVRLKDLKKESLAIHAGRKPIPVIGLVKDQIITKFLLENVAHDDKGYFRPDETYAKLCVFERHRGTGNVAAAPLKGYGIRHGAVATSVAHDSHNIIAAGDSDEDILLAVKEIENMQGGYVIVSDGRICGRLPLTVAGLMSPLSAGQVQRKIHDMTQEAYRLGVTMDCDPFITLSFMALPVIPELRLTDLGLVDVVNFKFISI